jgi:hypothetical protein
MMVSIMRQSADAIPDASEAYRLWADLYDAGLRMALSGGEEGTPDRHAARQRLARGMALALRERDEAWERLLGAAAKPRP